MPRRSKRFKKPQETELLISNSDNNSTPDLNPATNTKGLPILPDELYLEIISYYPTTPIPQNNRCCRKKIDNDIIRCQVLSALSQTSSNLRRFFLCYRWQRIEVYRSKAQHTMRNRIFALELVRQLEIVTIRDPTLAKYVEIVNVEIGAYARDSLLAELARCLALFPNLHTVQLKLEHDPKVNEDTITIPFKGYIYRSVRKVVVSSNALPFLVSCPESQFVDSYEFVYYPEPFWSYIAKYCPRIQATPSNAVIPTDRLRDIARAFPDIRNLTLREGHLLPTWSQPWLPLLNSNEIKKLKQLKILTFVELDEDEDQDFGVWYETARKLLLDIQHTDREDKVIVLVFHGGKTKTVVLRSPQPLPSTIEV